ncbi:MAG TPA: hypothetical protein VHV47_09565 [Opitutaceae bacterium]|nr:hypothetical protein [Opitutaceae bacterium]
MAGSRLIPAALAAVAALLTLPSAALAGEYFIPEGNSAVTQYTESIPSAGGEKGGHDKQASAGNTIGSKNAKKLEAAGPEGHAAAQVAVETAPVAPPQPAAKTPSNPESSPAHARHHQSGGSANSNPSGGSGSDPSGSHQASPQEQKAAARSTAPGSAAGEVAAKVLGGNSPGQFGILLPLILLGALVGAIAYRLKHRGEPAT